MNARLSMIAAAGFLTLSGYSVCLAGGRTQPAAPVIPPSFVQNQKQQAQQQQQKQQTPPATDSSSKNKSDTGSNTSKDRRDMRQYPYGNPYGYGQPQAGVYYPGGSPSGTSGNPNAAPQNNNNNANNAPAPGLFAPPPAPAAGNAPAPTPAAPPTPPDPEVIQATADLNAAMDHLRDTLMKTNPDYQQAVTDKKAAQAESAALHASDQPVTPEQLLAAATKSLQAATKVTQIERDAAATDQTVQDAKSKLQTVMAAHQK